MLELKSNYSPNEVISVKLISGDEFIGRYQSEDENNYYFSKPLTVTMAQIPNSNQFGISFMPFSVAFSMEKLKVPKSSIMLLDKTEQRLASSYYKETSNIDLSGGNNEAF